jgi:hypothetical protein
MIDGGSALANVLDLHGTRSMRGVADPRSAL